MRYLYKAYVIVNDAVYAETPAFIAKDEVSAKVKAILMTHANPDDAYVILDEIDALPCEDE